MTWLTAFLLTQVIEVPIWVAGLRRAPMSWGWRFAVAIGASALTHPVLWWVQPVMTGWLGEPAFFVVGETAVTVAEAAYVAGFGVPLWKAALLSVAANATSALVGAALIAFVL